MSSSKPTITTTIVRKKARKAKPTPKPTPKTAPVVEEEETPVEVEEENRIEVEEEVEEETEGTEDAATAEKKIEQRLDETIQELKDYKAMVRGFCNAVIDELQDAKREIRQLRRNQKKPRKQSDSKAPKKKGTFEIQQLLSDELCDLLELPHGSKMSRNQVTHNIQKYCGAHGLMEGRVIKPNKQMKKVLKGMPKTKEFKLTWLNLQAYIKHNYINEEGEEDE